MNTKSKLIELESQILSITGRDTEQPDKWISNSLQYNKVKELLQTRQHYLNDVFDPTDANMLRFRFLNDRLYRLSLQLYRRVKNLEAKRSLVMDCHDFDDDYEINGTLRFSFNDEDSVLKLDDDKVLGSNFTLMIKLIADLSYGKVCENIEEFWADSHILDDGESWNEYPFCGKKEFDDIVICHSIHQLTSHQLYSIPDILRLNDFWAEVKLTIQSITDQNGIRYITNK